MNTSEKERERRTPDNTVIRHKLRGLREGTGLTVEEMGEAIDRLGSRVSKWENGEGYPTHGDLLAYARYFGVSLEQLCDDAIADTPEVTIGVTAGQDPCLREVLDRLGPDRAMARLLLLPEGEEPAGGGADADRGAGLLETIRRMGRDRAIDRLLAIESGIHPATGPAPPGVRPTVRLPRLSNRQKRSRPKDDADA